MAVLTRDASDPIADLSGRKKERARGHPASAADSVGPRYRRRSRSPRLYLFTRPLLTSCRLGKIMKNVARTHCGCGEREGCSGRAVSEPGIPSSAGEVSPTWTLLESNYNSSTQNEISLFLCCKRNSVMQTQNLAVKASNTCRLSKGPDCAAPNCCTRKRSLHAENLNGPSESSPYRVLNLRINNCSILNTDENYQLQ